mmetsp:Transcript_16575/g.56516  ORF Transcript_16575/g.56516 Transcript_16575/m.56516 type:complete len:313 (+) Transcript_16575:109-1047(+)
MAPSSVAVLVLAAPCPRVPERLLQVRVLRLPPELPLYLAHVRIHLRVVPRPRLLLLHHVYGRARHLLARVDELAHAPPDARPDVVQRRRVGEVRHNGDVGVHEVHHMHVVAHARAVLGREVRAHHFKALDVPEGSVEARAGDAAVVAQVSTGVLAQAPLRVGADDVEVPEDGRLEPRVGVHVVLDHLLGHELGAAVRVYRLRDCLLRYRHGLWAAVRRARAAVHELAHAVPLHGLEHGERVGRYVVVVAVRLGHALADIRDGGKVDHEVHGRARGPEHGVNLGGAPEVQFHETVLAGATEATQDVHGAYVPA